MSAGWTLTRCCRDTGKLPKNYNSEVDPDPERWLPRRERSYYKGKRLKKTAVGKSRRTYGECIDRRAGETYIRPCSHLVPENSAWARLSLGTNVNTPFFQGPTSTHSGTLSVPEYKVETLSSDTKVGVYILGTNVWTQHHFEAVLGHQVWARPKIYCTYTAIIRSVLLQDRNSDTQCQIALV